MNHDLFLGVYLTLVGALLLIGLVSTIYTVSKVAPWWRPAYYMTIPMSLAMLVAFTLAFVRVHLNFPFENTEALRLATRYALLIAIFLFALEMILIPTVHRMEARMFKKQAGLGERKNQ